MPELRASVKKSIWLHCYTDGVWQEPLSEWVIAMQLSGLAEEADSLHVGFVGADRNINTAEAWLRERLNFTTVAREMDGYEQTTMRHIQPFAKDFDGAILYSHLKGSWAATQPSPPQREDHIEFNNLWRRSMQYDMITRWRECVTLLETYDAVGGHIIDTEYGGPYFAGTWWWSRAEHIRSLPVLQEDHRYRAEKWIGDNPDASLFDIRPGWPGDDTLWKGETLR